MRANVKHLLESFTAKERHACELIGIAVSSYGIDHAERAMKRYGKSW